MTGAGERADVGGSDAAAVEAQLRREQLRIIERTSIPGLVSCGVGSVVLVAVAQLWAGGEAMRSALYGIAGSTGVMALLWAATLRACRRDSLRQAFAMHFTANMIGTGLFFIFIERGEILGLLTAFVSLSAGAMILRDEAQQRVAWITIAVIATAGVIGESGWIEAVVLPWFVLYPAMVVAIVFGFRTPISAFRMFNEHLRSAREQALRNEVVARSERDRADAQARAVAARTEELREFAYVVSHDLRAPLINIEGFAAVLHETLTDLDEEIRRAPVESDGRALRERWHAAQPEVAEALQFIASGTAKMGALITGLLELSRIDSRPEQEVRVALAPLLRQLVDSLQHQIRERAVTVTVEDLPEIVADPVRIGQVFGNLLDNAIKYMPQRDPRQVRIGCSLRDGERIFEVADTGAGIAAESREQVFRPFKRLGGAEAQVGDGLGLAAVKRIVERHGGRIWVEDAAGGGAAFCFTWPEPTPGN